MVRQLDENSKVSRLWGMYLFSCISCDFPLVLSLIASNVAGQTKKTFVDALFFVAYCVGNIAGPQVFIASEAPRYPTAFATMIVCVSLTIIGIAALRTILVLENKRRDHEFGLSEDINNMSQENNEDLTDWEQRETFRYLY